MQKTQVNNCSNSYMDVLKLLEFRGSEGMALIP